MGRTTPSAHRKLQPLRPPHVNFTSPALHFFNYQIIMNFFGSRKKTPAAAAKPASNSPIEAIGKLKEQIRVMEKGGTHLEQRIRKCHMDAVAKSKKKNKRGAMLDLKRKKLLEKQLQQKQAQQFNLENQLFALENANSNKQMLDTMKVTNNAMSGVMNSVGGIDAIEELNEDMTEHMDMANEISDIMGQQMGDEFDEDELDAELEDLEAEVMEEEMMKQSEPAASHSSEEPFSLPAVPDDPLNMNTEDEDADALAQLEAEMA